MKELLLIMSLYSGQVESCTPDLPGYDKPWLLEHTRPCEWAGYECYNALDCLKCDILVTHCAI